MSEMYSIRTDNENLDRALRIAHGDICGNIIPYRAGLLESEEQSVMAGLDYNTPWTRDTAINIWNGLGLVYPEVSKNTLLSVLENNDGHIIIGGQYWDSVIWVIGAWQYYLYTGDMDFLKIAYEASVNTINQLEANEYSADFGLFRGPACYGDGVAAYPERYAATGGSSEILAWTKYNRKSCSPIGYGLPMHALSTNCIYYIAYTALDLMERQLFKQKGKQDGGDWALQAQLLRDGINRNFWDNERGTYLYLVDEYGGCKHQEGLGVALAILSGVADKTQISGLFKNTYVAPSGIPCVWPVYERYLRQDADALGRHCGTIWPHIQGFWAEAAAKSGEEQLLVHELDRLTNNVCRDKQCAEIYHPVTGRIYGGLQEKEGKGIVEWESCSRQTWSATALLRIALRGIAGMDFEPGGITFRPMMPIDLKYLDIRSLKYKGVELNILIEGSGRQVTGLEVNNVRQQDLMVRADGSDIIDVHIRVASL